MQSDGPFLQVRDFYLTRYLLRHYGSLKHILGEGDI